MPLKNFNQIFGNQGQFWFCRGPSQNQAIADGVPSRFVAQPFQLFQPIHPYGVRGEENVRRCAVFDLAGEGTTAANTGTIRMPSTLFRMETSSRTGTDVLVAAKSFTDAVSE